MLGTIETGWGSLFWFARDGPVFGAEMENLPKDEAEEQNGNSTHNSSGAAVFSVEYENQRGKNGNTLDYSAKNPLCHYVNPGKQGKYNSGATCLWK